MFGAWAKAPDDRDDLVLIVRPVRLDGADGASITGDRFTEQDAERLATLLDSTEYAEANEVRSALTARDEAVRKWRSSAPRTSVRSELERLRGIHKKVQAARISRARFSVEHARFYFSKDRSSTPSRETPWVDDAFNSRFAIRFPCLLLPPFGAQPALFPINPVTRHSGAEECAV